MALKPSEKWNKESVLAELREQAKGSGAATAQVFLSGPEVDVGEAARRVLREVADVSEEGAPPPRIGRVSTLAKSFSLTAAPAIFGALAGNGGIKSILPSATSDIYPKPTKVVRDPSND